MQVEQLDPAFLIALADHSTWSLPDDGQVVDQKVAEHGRSHEFQAELQLFIWQFIQEPRISDEFHSSIGYHGRRCFFLLKGKLELCKPVAL